MSGAPNVPGMLFRQTSAQVFWGMLVCLSKFGPLRRYTKQCQHVSPAPDFCNARVVRDAADRNCSLDMLESQSRQARCIPRLLRAEHLFLLLRPCTFRWQLGIARPILKRVISCHNAFRFKQQTCTYMLLNSLTHRSWAETRTSSGSFTLASPLQIRRGH